MIKNENVEGEPAYDETYRRGPVVMRGPMIPKDNTYANLLAPEESTDWLHADPWRVLRIQAEFVDGFVPPGKAAVQLVQDSGEVCHTHRHFLLHQSVCNAPGKETFAGAYTAPEEQS